ncbi:hypothetical protein KC19_VG071000 [Ceratodon purpureus]|uniref:Uncharacterized protein n=1 Tax=Ceratodon purpureus TaxID=3225 RepID=A0A8T0HMM0_CERPU|nr:hypothetical protein KC19_VG071000 [Ceratodon purpureus]
MTYISSGNSKSSHQKQRNAPQEKLDEDASRSKHTHHKQPLHVYLCSEMLLKRRGGCTVPRGEPRCCSRDNRCCYAEVQSMSEGVYVVRAGRVYSTLCTVKAVSGGRTPPPTPLSAPTADVGEGAEVGEVRRRRGGAPRRP